MTFFRLCAILIATVDQIGGVPYIMNDSSYEEYKRNLSRSQKKHDGFRNGIVQAIVGICLLLYTLFILPFHAGNVCEIRGDEMTAGKAFYPEKVYYIENLQLLRVKTDTDDGQIYCIAKFFDRDQNDWIISFTPGRNEQLAEQIKLSGSFGNELDLTTGGYFLIEYLEDLPFEADSFYTVYGEKYADAEGQNMLGLNAEYLCTGDDNYTLQALLRPGIPLASLAVGIFGVIFGGISLIRNRPRREA